MKIAISTDGNSVSAHFGRCPLFTIVEIEDNKIIKKETIDNPGHHPAFLPQFLGDKGVNAIIAGGAGQRALDLFNEKGIEVIVGISGTINEVIDKIVAGTLEGGETLCNPGAGRGYGLEKTECEDKNMKICVTSEGDNLDAGVDPRFGRCKYFLFVDTDTLSFEAIENKNINGTGGVGIQSAQLLSEKEIKVVLTGNVGPNAFQTLKAAGIDVITGVSGTVKEAVEKHKKGELKTTDNPNVDSKFGTQI